jgi:hypothetical protein
VEMPWSSCSSTLTSTIFCNDKRSFGDLHG